MIMSQLSTLYYFGFFIVIMPLLGLIDAAAPAEFDHRSGAGQVGVECDGSPCRGDRRAGNQRLRLQGIS